MFLDEEEDQGLYVKEGRYGTWTKRGFQAVSNFDLKIMAVVICENLFLRGYALKALKIGVDEPVSLFVPEKDICITLK